MARIGIQWWTGCYLDYLKSNYYPITCGIETDMAVEIGQEAGITETMAPRRGFSSNLLLLCSICDNVLGAKTPECVP